jgi:hypothetical protein
MPINPANNEKTSLLPIPAIELKQHFTKIHNFPPENSRSDYRGIINESHSLYFYH